MSKIGIKVTFIEDITSDKVKAALTPQTRLVWMEICTNPMLKVMDVLAVANVLLLGIRIFVAR
jgi:O-acetylhomoserine/O-acetylserine sulfhydrylase-like pyridoxal-dependent enzyme